MNKLPRLLLGLILSTVAAVGAEKLKVYCYTNYDHSFVQTVIPTF